MRTVSVLLSGGAVLVAAVVFVATSPTQEESAPASAAAPAAAPTPPTTAPPPVRGRRAAGRKPKPPVRRGDTYVEVFNNSGISGLAASTAARAQGAGWQVVGSDNWYGTIAASTVYYPAGKRAQAALLAKDLGIARVKPTFAPMRGDRLTVILTTDYV